LWAGIQHPSEARFVPLGGIAMFAFGLALVRGGGWFARNDTEWLSKIIMKALSSA
jgi:hypothetical protein